MKLTVLLALLLLLCGFRMVEASSLTTIPNLVGGKLVLRQTSYIKITAWLGTASCRVGQVNLENPEVKLVDSSVDNEKAKLDSTKNRRSKAKTKTIIYNYAAGRPFVKLGPYVAGTEIVLSIDSGSFCGKSRNSNDKLHTRLNQNGTNSWTIGWEDWSDNDIDDLFTEITVLPLQGIIPTKAFADLPVYKLPYPAGVSQKFTVLPGKGEHANSRAYDISMRKGDLLVASEMGLVLWVEDSFGSGACNSNLRNQTNVIVIQTESGVNQTYIHLNQGSAKVTVGQVVKQGEMIANAGNSGFVCSDTGDGTHLHIEWQKNCYDIEQAKKRRLLKGSRIGEPTLTWSCPAFPADAPYNFYRSGKPISIGRLPSTQISDNGPN